jgi:NADH:ubiquinone oxidoreductase subunit 6 (subunit J)
MPFEVVSIVLLAALIGGIVLARRDPTEESEALR